LKEGNFFKKRKGLKKGRFKARKPLLFFGGKGGRKKGFGLILFSLGNQMGVIWKPKNNQRGGKLVGG